MTLDITNYSVEMARIEPASKTVQIKYSTNIVYLFCIQLKNRNKQKFFNLFLRCFARAVQEKYGASYPYN